jgi:hypothetical protein
MQTWMISDQALYCLNARSMSYNVLGHRVRPGRHCGIDRFLSDAHQSLQIAETFRRQFSGRRLTLSRGLRIYDKGAYSNQIRRNSRGEFAIDPGGGCDRLSLFSRDKKAEAVQRVWKRTAVEQ